MKRTRMVRMKIESGLNRYRFATRMSKGYLLHEKIDRSIR